MQHHHSGVAAANAVEHPDVNGIQTVANPAYLGRRYGRRGRLTDRGHHRVERNAGQLRRAAFEKILCAVLPALERQGDLVGLEQGLEFRIVVVTHTRDVDTYLAIFAIPVGTDKCEGRIAAHHLAVPNVQHAAARAVHRMHLNLVESLFHCCSGLSAPKRLSADILWLPCRLPSIRE